MDEEQKRTGIGLEAGARHYRAFVGPPQNYDLMSAVQFHLMTALGLREFHYLLDIGCGSLRGGKLFIPYLLPGRYYGVEPERWLVEEGIKQECGEDLVEIKKPTFDCFTDFGFFRFKRQFDFMLAQSIFTHATQAQIRKCLAEAARCMTPSCILAASIMAGPNDYTGTKWFYPACITYRIDTVSQMARQAALDTHPLDWTHPNGHRWLAFTHQGAPKPIPPKP